MSSHTLVQPAIPPLLFSPPTHRNPSIPLHPHSPFSWSTPPHPRTPSLPALLNSVDGMPRTLTVFSHATHQCWPLPMRKWFRTWTRTSSRDSPLSTQSSQELLLPPLLPNRLDFSSCTDTWTHSHKHIQNHFCTLEYTRTHLQLYQLKMSQKLFVLSQSLRSHNKNRHTHIG